MRRVSSRSLARVRYRLGSRCPRSRPRCRVDALAWSPPTAGLIDDHADRWGGAHEEEPCGESEAGGVTTDGFSHQVPDVDPQETAEWPDSFDVVLETRGRSRARFWVGQATTDDE